MKVTQVLCAAGPVDAVTNQGLACRALFDSWGWSGRDYSAVIAPGLGRTLRPLSELRATNGEVLLLHYSGYARGLEPLFSSRRRSLLISHNITPAHYFWATQPVEGVRCELARDQLASLAEKVGALAAVSAFNAGELQALSGREPAVIPVLFDRAQLPAAAPRPAQGPPTILFVGRLAPHKRQDLVIRAFARYRELEPDARLVLVGVPMTRDYGAHLERLAGELAPGAVAFESGISRERLAERYRSAHAFLCLSEHEGFCIPLLEAFHFGVPVIARDEGAVGEVLGDAGVLLDRGDELEVVAELLRIVVADTELQGVLRARGEQRLERFSYARTAEALRSALEAV